MRCLLALTLFFPSLAYAPQSVPKLDIAVIRAAVRPKVVMVLSSKQGGGTGFHVKAPSGKTYILTNYHVCRRAQNDKVLIQDELNKLSMVRRIVKRADSTDLCLIEAEPGIEGIPVANRFDEDSDLITYGHPRLDPMEEHTGRFARRTLDEVMAFPIRTPEDLEECQKPMFRIRSNFLIGEHDCVAKIKAIDVTFVCIPGMSGSPVVNQVGQVVGVVYAHTWDYQGVMIKLEDVQEFLKDL